MSQAQPAYELRFFPGFKEDMKHLGASAMDNPRGPEDRLLRVTLNKLAWLKDGGHSTHALDYMPSYGDISDCDTTYVGTDPDVKPSHRLIWREFAPSRPNALPVREVIALGERQFGAAYHIAAQRLGRPVGVSLNDLNSSAEPVRTPQHRVVPSYEPPNIPDDGPEFG